MAWSLKVHEVTVGVSLTHAQAAAVCGSQRLLLVGSPMVLVIASFAENPVALGSCPLPKAPAGHGCPTPSWGTRHSTV